MSAIQHCELQAECAEKRSYINSTLYVVRTQCHTKTQQAAGFTVGELEVSEQNV